MNDLQPGDEFAGHRIEAVAGRGGMGVVYRARQLDLDRLVALKLIAASLSDDPKFRTRFIAESRTAASIDHPNVIPVYYAGEADHSLFIAMRFVEGEDLRARVRREGHLAPGKAADVIGQVAAALDAAHARGLVHRDVKPGNVLLGDRDHAYLTDFGLTKRIDSATGGGATRAGGWVGTLGYVSPEQIRGEGVDARSDVYALGCLLFYALTGVMPYQRDSDEATLWAHLNEPPPEVTQTVSGVPDGFEGVIARALQKDPDDRFPSAGDLGRAALAAAGRRVEPTPERLVATGGAAPAPVFADETVISAAPTRPATAALEDRKRRTPPRLGPFIGAGVVAVGAIVLVILLATSGDDPNQSHPPGLPRTATTSTKAAKPDTPARKRAGRLVAPVSTGRANAIVATSRRVWTVSSANSRLALISTKTNTIAHHRPSIGMGGNAVTAGFGRVWIAKSNRSVIAYKSSDQTRTGAPISLPTGTPVAIAAGGGAIWVGARRRVEDPVQPSVLYKIDPATMTVSATVNLPSGLQNLAAGAGGVWVIDGSRRNVRRIGFSSGTAGRPVPTGDGAYAVATSGDVVWVTNFNDDTVTRIDANTRARAAFAAGRGPRGIDASAKAVWVADYLGDRVTRLDPETGKRVGSVKVGLNPFLVSLSKNTAWISVLGEYNVSRVDF